MLINSFLLFVVLYSGVVYGALPKYVSSTKIESHSLRVGEDKLLVDHRPRLNFVDFDGDTLVDIITSAQRNIYFYKNIGEKTKPVYKSSPVIFSWKVATLTHLSIDVVDWDEDNKFEFIAGCRDGRIYELEVDRTNYRITDYRTLRRSSMPIIQHQTEGYLYASAIKDNLLYLAAGRYFEIWNITNPYNPKKLSTTEIKLEDVQAQIYNLVIRGDVVYGACGKAGLLIWDVKEPGSPALLNEEQATGAPIAPAYWVELSPDNNYAYVVGEKTLRIVDVSDLVKPEEIGTLILDGELRRVYYGWAARSPVLYVAAQQAGVYKIDINNPEQPRIAARVPPPAHGMSMDMYIHRDYIYVAADRAGLQILDKDLKTVRLISDFSAISIAVMGHYLYICEGFNPDNTGNFSVWNIEDPPNVRLICRNKLNYTPRHVLIHGKLAYVSLGNDGLCIVDVEDVGKQIDIGADSVPFIFDLDEDGLKDLIVGNEAGLIYFFRNIGAPAFPSFGKGFPIIYGKLNEIGDVVDVGQNATPLVCDWDGDGIKDIISGNAQGKVYCLHGVGITVATITSASISWQLTFSIKSKSTITVGGRDIDVGFFSAPTVVDFNEDGLSDLVVAAEDAWLYLYLNTNRKTALAPIFAFVSGIQSTGSELFTGIRAAVYICDFNNDYLYDIVVGESYGELNLWLNHGARQLPLFNLPYRLTTEQDFLDIGYNAGVVVVDWDEDGAKDLIVGNSFGKVYFLKNIADDHSPRFAKPQAIMVAGVELDVGFDAKPVVGDIDGDGLVDLIVGNSTGNLFFCKNNGTNKQPRFVAATLMKADGVVIDVGDAAAPNLTKYNDDDLLDILVGDENGYINLFINVGSPRQPIFKYYGKLQFRSDIDVGRYAVPMDIDWDGDGIKDLIVSNEEGTIYFFKATYVNSPPTISIYSPVGTYTKNVTVWYVLSDRESDSCHLTVEYSFDEIKWYPATSADLGDGVDGLTSSPGGVEHSYVWDALKDIGKTVKKVVLRFTVRDTYSVGNSVLTKQFVVDNFIEPLLQYIYAAEGEIYLGENTRPVVCDWNRDNRKDIVVGNNLGNVYVYLNEGTNISPKFGKRKKILQVKGYSAPFVIDYNNDGKKDLVVGDGEGKIWFFKNINTDYEPKFNEGVYIKDAKGDIDVGDCANVYVYDWNNDGKKDILVGNNVGKVYLYLNVGPDADPKFNSFEVLVDVGGGYVCPAVIDWNKNYKKDLLVGNAHGEVLLYINWGSNNLPRLAPPTKIKIAGEVVDVGDDCGVFAVDWDEDGIFDLICGNRAGKIILGRITKPIVNTPPSVEILLDERIYQGTISIPYRLADADGDSCRIQVDYSIDGLRWYRATTPSVLENLFAPPHGLLEYTFLWSSETDLPGTECVAMLRITPYDPIAKGLPATATIRVDNFNRLPQIKNLQLLHIDSGILFTFNLVDLDNDICSVKVEYKREDQPQWFPCTIAKLSKEHPGTITNNIITGLLPQTNLGYVWLAAVDLANTKGKYCLRLLPSDDGKKGFDTTRGMEAYTNIDYFYERAFIAKAHQIAEFSYPYGTLIRLLEKPLYDLVIGVNEAVDGTPKALRTIKKITLRYVDNYQAPVKLSVEIGIHYEEVLPDIERNLCVLKYGSGWYPLTTLKHNMTTNYIFVKLEIVKEAKLKLIHIIPSLKESKVHPNPFKAYRDASGNKVEGITFETVPGAQIKVYDLLGGLVFEVTADEHGKYVYKPQGIGSGIYFYVIKKQSEYKKGKLVIIK